MDGIVRQILEVAGNRMAGRCAELREGRRACWTKKEDEERDAA